MSEMANTLMDLAERHLRAGGFAGFSYRDLAAEAGIKSASVHYHFPTKENLVAAVLRRYKGRVADYIDQLAAEEADPVRLMAKAFGSPVHSKDKLCPCVSLGGAFSDLPGEIQGEVKGYYEMWLDRMEKQGLSRGKARTIMSMLVGAQLLALILDDVKAYDEVADEVVKEFAAVAA